jgi:hypothetical protein
MHTTAPPPPQGRFVVTGGDDALVKLWGCLPASAVTPADLPPNESFVGHPATVHGARTGSGASPPTPWTLA